MGTPKVSMGDALFIFPRMILIFFVFVFGEPRRILHRKPRHTTTRARHAHVSLYPPNRHSVWKPTRARASARAMLTWGGAIPGLLDDIVVTHVLRSEHFDDPADLARLPR